MAAAHGASEASFLAVPRGFVNASHEEDSWQRLHDEALDRFFAGTYAGDYQAARIAEFEQLLPEQPPWKS